MIIKLKLNVSQQYKGIKQQDMRYLTYFITFLAYSCVHIMRMSIPFVQLKIMQHLTISKLEMGIANASLYIIIGISYFKLALFPIKQPQFTYLWSMIIAAVSFLCIPLLVYARIHTHWFLYLIMAGFGWFQTVAWPVLLTLVHTYFIPSRDGCMLGFWSANTSIGNIAGFALCTVLIYYLKFPFQVPLIVGGIMSIMTTISVYYLSPVESVQEDQQHLLKQQNIKDRCKDYKEIVATPIVLLMLVMLCMLKSILYGILLWLPMYFEKSGFSQYKGYIPIAMNVAAILGSIFLGLVYEKVNNKFMRALIVLTTLVLTVVIFYLIQHIQFTVQNRLILLLLISIIGFCVMGNFNILSTHETTTICEELNLQISAFSSLSMGFGSLFTGIVQIVIGFAATEDSNSIFVIFFVMSILLAVLEIVRAILFWRKNKSNQKVQAGHQNLEQ